VIDQFGPNVYCVEHGGGTPSKTDAKCEDGLSKALVKFAGAKSKCYAKCGTAAQKAGQSSAAHGCTPTATDGPTVTCINTAQSKSIASLNKACFVAPATFPSCYDGTLFRPNTAAGWTALTEAAVDGTDKKIDCGSPSGAFLAD
jgi:hypothetical protein